jgi:hypothetical protein
MKTIRIPHHHNEASAILGVQNHGLLELHQWERAFWIVSDEQPAERSIAILGQRADGEWEVKPLRIVLSSSSTRKKTQDAETIARAGSWIYVFGSHFGAKQGPLDPSRHFCLRFNETFVASGKKKLEVKGHLERRSFLLHRLINDALAESGLELISTEGDAKKDLVDATRKLGAKEHKRWAGLVKKGDVPLNIEGSTFLHGGHLLLGLRYPTTVDGHPILVEVEGIDRLFDDGAEPPKVIGFHVLEDIGSARRPAGVRELDSDRRVVHVITGNLDSDPDESAVVAEHPEGTKRICEHWEVSARGTRSLVRRPKSVRARKLPHANVEGLALEGERVWYALDDKDIVLVVTDEPKPGRRILKRQGA